MKFESAKDMYDAACCNDLCNKELGLFVFLSNDLGALCYHHIDEEEYKKLKKAAADGKYCTVCLSAGGYFLEDIDYDPNEYDEDEWYDLYLAPSYEFCERYYEHDGWEYC